MCWPGPSGLSCHWHEGPEHVPKAAQGGPSSPQGKKQAPSWAERQLLSWHQAPVAGSLAWQGAPLSPTPAPTFGYQHAEQPPPPLSDPRGARVRQGWILPSRRTQQAGAAPSSGARSGRSGMVALPRVPTMRVPPRAEPRASLQPALPRHLLPGQGSRRLPAAGAIWKDTFTLSQAGTGHGTPSAPSHMPGPLPGAPSPTHGSGHGWARP